MSLEWPSLQRLWQEQAATIIEWTTHTPRVCICLTTVQLSTAHSWSELEYILSYGAKLIFMD